MTFIEETTFDKIIIPEKIYKYRNWSNAYHKRLLTHNEIYFSAPSNIDEQHECNLETDYDSITPQMIFEYAFNEAKQMGFKTEYERLKFAERTVNNTPFFDKRRQDFGDAQFKAKMDAQLSIFCVSEVKDNPTLWNMFSGGHSGFCVGINSRKMFENRMLLGGGGKVNYYSKKDMPKRKGLTLTEEEGVLNMLTVVFSLPDMFAEEKEYRLFKMNITKREAEIGKECIEEIILGNAISEKDKTEILEVANKRFPLAVILQSEFDTLTNKFSFQKL